MFLYHSVFFLHEYSTRTSSQDGTSIPNWLKTNQRTRRKEVNDESFMLNSNYNRAITDWLRTRPFRTNELAPAVIRHTALFIY